MPQHDWFAQFEAQPAADGADFFSQFADEAVPAAQAPPGGAIEQVLGAGQGFLRRLAEGPQSSYPLVTGMPPEGSTVGLPTGRILTAAFGAAKGALRNTPIVGPMLRGAAKGGAAAWKGSAETVDDVARQMPNLLEKTPRTMPDLRPPAPPAASVAPAPLGPSPQPKLSVKDVAEALRKQYGSEKASQMLYGKTQKAAEAGSVVANAAARKDAIKRLAPRESTLPNAARQQILQRLEQGGPTSEAWNYVTRAPNERARDFMLRLMRGTGK